MSLAPGTRLGAYEIVALIGAGGMGEVYRARDTRLKREVAIKVLPDAFITDFERIARFQREAELLATLNHQNIAQIYGLEDRALVLELVEGSTLADRIAQGPIPLDEALPIARQIAEALEAAHEHGIIHRDLKPANIKLTNDGTLKVLDFGLAKAVESGSKVPPDLYTSPTITTPAITMGGVVLGTAAYMSPEQVNGRAADHRSDVWAFGCVLYEMLTARRAFPGGTMSETLAAVLKEEPDLARAPARVQRLLRACLQKDRKQRLQSIGDARLLLDVAPGAAPVTRRRVAWAVAVAFALVATLALWALWRRPTSNAPQAAMRIDIDVGAAVATTNLGPDAMLSPDGTRLVVVAQGANGKSRLLTRRVDQPLLVELRGSEGAYAPFFSPDGQWLAFFAEGRLKKTRVDGGEPVILCDAPAGRGGSWGEDGNIIAALDSQVGLSLVPSSEGGKIVPLTTLAPGENSHRWPQILPGAKIALFTSNTTFANYDEASISALSLPDRKWKIVMERAGMYARYVPSGHLIYVTKGTLFAVPFDLTSLAVRGRPSPVVEEVSNNTGFGFSRLDISASGMLVYRRGRTEALRTIHWVDSSGSTGALKIEPAVYQFPRVSPDGNKLLWTETQGASADLFVYDWRRGSKTKLTDGNDVYTYPVWSPDGQYVVFSSSRGMYWTRADAASKPQPLTASKALQWPHSFTPDSGRLVFAELNPAGSLIQTMRLDEGSGQLRAGTPELFLQTSSPLPFPAFSPDGRWLAYADAESGGYEVYVREFPDKGTRSLISSGGGTMPVWSKNGRELFYRTEDSRIMVASYAVKGSTFAADKPRVWSEKRLANTGLSPNFDLAPDGKLFAVLMPAEGAEPPEMQRHVTLLINLFDELRRIAPATKQ